MEVRFCPDCNEDRPVSEFSKGTNRGLQYCCKKHTNIRICIWARQRRFELREKVFEKLGSKCNQCGFGDKRALQIDHVLGNGYEKHGRNRGQTFLKKVLADESGQFQILCANCNWIKRAERQEEKTIIHGV